MDANKHLSRRLSWVLGVSLVLFVVLVPLLRYRWVYVESKRLRVVEPGKFYRSGLMTANGLSQAIKEHGIKRGMALPVTSCYIERRSSIARAIVPASTYSSSPPTGTPRARRVTARPRALSVCPR